jgi:hypothetical protein
MIGLRFMGVTVLVTVLLGASLAQAQSRESSISILSNETLTVSGKKGEDTVEVKFSVLNTSDSEIPVEVKFQASSDEKVKVGPVEPEVLPANDATRLKITLTGVEDLNEAATGQLVLKGGGLPVAQSVQVDPPAPDNDLPATLILAALATAVLSALFVVGALGKSINRLFNNAPNPKWEFSSWATTLTAVGAAFGAVLGEATFPPYPEHVSSAELVNLNIFFGVLVLVGPFLFETLRSYSAERDPTKVERTGSNLTLLIASAFTLWAVLGQLGAFALLAWELLGGNWLAHAAAAAVAIFALLACWYFFSTTSEQVRRDWEAEEQAAKAKPGAEGEPVRSWSLL